MVNDVEDEGAIRMGSSAATQSPSLVVNDLETGYLGSPVVYGVSFELRPGMVTALFGHNGAGKTSTMKAAAGLNPTYAGTVELHGADVTKARSDVRVKQGLVYLPQDHAVFATMRVHDNLVLGGTTAPNSDVVDERMHSVFELFPRLADRRNQLAGTMSGGEQRMLSMGIALMAGARVLMLDEPSLGLAPLITRQLFDATRRLAEEEGLAILLVEQVIGQTLEYADHVYVMRSGAIVAEHTREEALARDDWWDVY